MKCKNCEKEAIKYSKYSKGEFCSKKCACSYSTKEKRVEINEKVSKTLTKDKIEKKCKQCDNLFFVKIKKIKQEFCCVSCATSFREKDELFKLNKIKQSQDFFKDPEKRKRLRDIGRRGGFGKKGYINDIYFSSSIEEKCFKFLIDNNIDFEPHKNIPDSSYITDIYLIKYNLWIEIDGINRTKLKNQKFLGKRYESWLQKLSHYKKVNLNYIIVYNLNDLKEQLLQLI
jgi:hypothetical protein